ncbi:MAG TPA: hypothetical protein PL180_21220, partial [Spirochaetota bacterium]|nr:hypothetical protein [Spirochaetota bacterium]
MTNFIKIINSFAWSFLSVLAAVSIVIIKGTPSSASGVGVQFITGGGGFLYEQSELILSNKNSIGTTMTVGCGFVADTNLGKKSVFNYR